MKGSSKSVSAYESASCDYLMCFRHVWIWLSLGPTPKPLLFLGNPVKHCPTSSQRPKRVDDWDNKTLKKKLNLEKTKRMCSLRGSNTHVFHIQFALALVDGQGLPCTKSLQVLRHKGAAAKELRARCWRVFFNGTFCIFQVSFRKGFEMLGGDIQNIQKWKKTYFPSRFM